MGDNTPVKIEEGRTDTVAPVPDPAPKTWVKFEDETEPKPVSNSTPEKNDVAQVKLEKPPKKVAQKTKDPLQDDSPAVLSTESVQVNLERSLSRSMTESTGNNVAILDPKPLRNVELPVATVEPIRQGFCKFFYYQCGILDNYLTRTGTFTSG